jgi:transposase
VIDPEISLALFKLHEQGMPLRELARRFSISRNTVRRIIRAEGCGPGRRRPRRDRAQIDSELLQRLYRECNGWVQRMHEKLSEEEGIQIGYSTLTRLLREAGIGQPPSQRCDQVPDEPGLEMQHDTTVYQVPLAGQPTRLVASLLYLRYSKRRYLKFYRAFDRFAMKCFLHEALMHWGCSARQCVIDNTNLARLRGSGSGAVIVPEMEAFGRLYGFQFICHAIGHANRKAGEERSFWTVETNFLPGRVFASLEDLNHQALVWATERMEHRPQGKSRLIPAKAFEYEATRLTSLPPDLPPPYQAHERLIDQYGYVVFLANYYWVPGERRGEVKLLQYADRIQLFQQGEQVAEYPLPPEQVKQQRFSPAGLPLPRHQPKNRRRRADTEARQLRAMGQEVADYLDFVLKAPGVQRHQFVRGLLALSGKVSAEVFRRAAARALRYRITHLETLRRVAWWILHELDQPLPDVEVDPTYRNREAFREGAFTEPPSLAEYDVFEEPVDETHGDDSFERKPEEEDSDEQ